VKSIADESPLGRFEDELAPLGVCRSAEGRRGGQ
jgi:hypothetical protein